MNLAYPVRKEGLAQLIYAFREATAPSPKCFHHLGVHVCKVELQYIASLHEGIHSHMHTYQTKDSEFSYIQLTPFQERLAFHYQ